MEGLMNIIDIIYEPVVRTTGIEIWRLAARILAEYITNLTIVQGGILDINRTRPTGSLLLEGLLEAYHLYNITEFYEAECFGNSYPEPKYFDGIIFADKYGMGSLGYPYIPSFGTSSIRDLNLVPNNYGHRYLFSLRENAENFIKHKLP
jgi:hypothetical protein